MRCSHKSTLNAKLSFGGRMLDGIRNVTPHRGRPIFSWFIFCRLHLHRLRSEDRGDWRDEWWRGLVPRNEVASIIPPHDFMLWAVSKMSSPFVCSHEYGHHGEGRVTQWLLDPKQLAAGRRATCAIKREWKERKGACRLNFDDSASRMADGGRGAMGPLHWPVGCKTANVPT